MKSRTYKLLAVAALLATFYGCKKVIFVPDEDNGTTTTNTGIATHDNGFAANYDVVFDNEKVHRMDIIFTSEEWADMQTDLADKTAGGGGPGGGFLSNHQYGKVTAGGGICGGDEFESRSGPVGTSGLEFWGDEKVGSGSVARGGFVAGGGGFNGWFGGHDVVGRPSAGLGISHPRCGKGPGRADSARQLCVIWKAP